jgi:hypothetical protein
VEGPLCALISRPSRGRGAAAEQGIKEECVRQKGVSACGACVRQAE